MANIADGGEHPDLFAFLVIAWYTYRKKRMLQFSVVIRAIIGDASIYFIAMIALQIYVQLSLSLTKVRSFSELPFHFAIIDHEYPRVSINNVRFREYATNLNDDSPRLTFSTSRNEVHTECKHFLFRSPVISG